MERDPIAGCEARNGKVKNSLSNIDGPNLTPVVSHKDDRFSV